MLSYNYKCSHQLICCSAWLNHFVKCYTHKVVIGIAVYPCIANLSFLSSVHWSLQSFARSARQSWNAGLASSQLAMDHLESFTGVAWVASKNAMKSFRWQTIIYSRYQVSYTANKRYNINSFQLMSMSWANTYTGLRLSLGVGRIRTFLVVHCLKYER